MKRYISLLLIILVAVVIETSSSSIFINAENIDNQCELIATNNDVDLLDEYIMYGEIENNVYSNSIGSGTNDYDQLNTLFLVDNYATYYFSQLKDNFGYNHKETCSYVATAMLLSYYDTYWDDRIIERETNGVVDEIWDKEQEHFLCGVSIDNNTQSPGIENDRGAVLSEKSKKGYDYDEQLSDSDYMTFVRNNNGDFFHLELVRLGKDELQMSYGIYPWDIVDLLEHYLYTVKGFDRSYVEVNYEDWFDTEDNKKAYIVSKIQAGIPVIVSGGTLELNGWAHTYIIYDYDAQSGELYCHMGWHDKTNSNGIKDTTHIAFSSIGGTLIGGVVSLDFKTEHSCSNNYTYVEDGETKSVCSCYFPCHPAHEHAYKANNASTHQYDCGCYANDKNYYDHNFEYVSDGTNTHSLKCKDCEYVASTESHNNQYTRNNTKTHVAECQVCGHVETVEHNFEYTSASDYQHINTCIDCGFTYHDDHDFIYNEIDSGYHTTTCSKCDYTSTDEHYMFTFVGANQHGDKCHECGYVDESTLEDHVYDCWKYLNNTTHIRECRGCSARINETAPHAFVPTKPISLQVVCVGCGYTKMKDSDYGNIIMSNTKVSLNGSYIMPDGTIMLVDEDIEAYLNGTLVFYNKDDLPVVQ